MTPDREERAARRRRDGGPGAGADGDGDGGPFEPDYRFTLANERTFLAWQRTALGLLAAAVAVVQLVPELAFPWARYVLGGALAILAILTAGAGLTRWQQVDAAMRRGLPLPPHRVPRLIGLGLALVAVLVVLLLSVAAVGG